MANRIFVLLRRCSRGADLGSARDVATLRATAVSARGYSISVSISPAYFHASAEQNQPARTGIVSNVVPFLAVALIGAKNMIEEFALPERCSRGR
jgi:hypothetical protein